MSIKTRKIKLIAVGETSQDRTKVYNHLKDVATILSEVGNRIIRLQINNLYEIEDLMETMTKGEAIKVLTERLSTSIQNSGYRLTTEYANIPSEIRTGFNQSIYKTLSNNFFDIKKGKMSVPSFRKTNINIPFSGRKTPTGGTDTIYIENDKYYFNLPTVNKSPIKPVLNLFFGKDRSNNKVIVDRIISGEYTLCDSSIQVKDNEFYMLLTYKQPETKSVDMNPDKIMGIDIGINRPVSFYIDNEKYQPDQIRIGEKIQHDRMKFYKHRKSLQESIKYSKGGHGIKRKTRALNDLRDREKNWGQTINHTITRELIKIAQEYGVGIIKMEDLTGITTNTKEYFLKSWAYYQLQTYIEYKAKEVGIQIQWVNPKDTSNTCPTCKDSNPLNRNDKDKTKFRCINSDCKDFDKVKDADIVGAYNICYKEGTEVKGKSKKGIMEKGKKKKEALSI
jgi:IS605 OrfB family transposase